MRYGGREIIETNERVPDVSSAFRYFKWRAEAHVRKYPPLVPFYHLKIEKVGLFKYEIVAYQNIIDPTKGTTDGGK